MKSIYSNTFTALFCLSLAMATNLYAAEHSDDHEKEKHEEHKKTDASSERVQHGSHEHGEARLTVAKTAVGMEISLETPAANLFGFEYQANNEEEHKAVQATKEKLNAGETLFIANKAAKCKLAEVDIKSNIISSHEKESHKEDHKEDHDKKKDDHDEDHKEDHDKKKDDHDEEKEHDKHDISHSKETHKDEHDKKETHSDVDATWAFKCENPKALESIEVKLFSQFPKGFEHLNVEWVTSNGAGTAKLEANGSVKLK